ncbi:MerR family transcriptional regulator [Bacillus sp. AGMB 02131]|uniref:MerR family transcriptional regulator n=1 Tax=Peribacillus faecalis TaxID=2772559 RepID=A0A927CWU9_9BACI|nr:MerR family transcriptional regulator [Peribacillus faecalis]MBD3108207.1 MerR family transcriptional regulator [Peribacillus faecalis]
MTRTYHTSEIAKLGHVHPNTVRVYEEWGYLSKVPRAENGYRVYQDIHVVQLQIARLVFRHEILQKNLRKRAAKIAELSGKQQFDEALEVAELYLRYLQEEHVFSLKAIETVERWISKPSCRMNQRRSYSHQEAAKQLNITEETLRNWERNGLFHVARNSQRHRIYEEEDLERLLVIRSLRSAHFSIAAILRLVSKANEGQAFDIKDVLNTPTATDDIVRVTDRLEEGLREAIEDVKKLIELLKRVIGDSQN